MDNTFGSFEKICQILFDYLTDAMKFRALKNNFDHQVNTSYRTSLRAMYT